MHANVSLRVAGEKKKPELRAIHYSRSSGSSNPGEEGRVYIITVMREVFVAKRIFMRPEMIYVWFWGVCMGKKVKTNDLLTATR